MTTFVKTFIVAAALFAGTQSITAASAQSEGIRMACQAGSITPHGVWDCR